ncbi:hypothetical protein [Corynebacterium sp. HS2168-gen11]|uniref:hypothetical protein n=1 Tax=Corynebacterium sp. HS2168-gen11 TaxID=2974027 RepID=UPI00216B47B8|nr:hypothetical protein [Corynebacterium sp. HS2168-gen11]MCS4536211.1 hypothetical protein [Corynebacterium sp. HS2168-gen11]
MSQGLKEFIKVIALGCIVAAVIIASRFISLSNVISLQTEGTSVTTAASPGDTSAAPQPGSDADVKTEPSQDTAAAPRLGSDAEIAAELASRIANMTPEERQEAERPPHPGEDKAQLVNPNGETLYQQYRGSYFPETGLTRYGNLFSSDNLPTRHSFEGIVPAPQVVPLPGSLEDPDLHKKAAEVVTNMFSIRTQNYASYQCGVASFKSEDTVPYVTSKYSFQCDLDPNPYSNWIELMEQDAYVRIENLREVPKAPDSPFNVAADFDNEHVVITYNFDFVFYDKNNVVIDRSNLEEFSTYWKKIDNDWKLSYMIPIYL